MTARQAEKLAKAYKTGRRDGASSANSSSVTSDSNRLQIVTGVPICGRFESGPSRDRYRPLRRPGWGVGKDGVLALIFSRKIFSIASVDY